MKSVDAIPLHGTAQDCLALLRYLRSRGVLPREFKFPNMQVAHSTQQDKMNAKKARAFAHVVPGRWTIYCAAVIERLPPEFRMGLLLHEIGHLAIFGFKNLDSEIDVDEWILKSVPEARYKYENVSYFRDGETQVALNVQRVGSEFYGRVSRGAGLEA
jgi:hypothetical protein